MAWDIDWYIIGVIVLLTLCSVLTRSTYMVFGHRFPLPDGLRSALRYAPVAALVAIVLPELFPAGADGGSLPGARALAAALAVLLFWRTQSALAIIVGGMLAFWLINWLPFA